MKKRSIFLAALAAVMIAAGTVGSAWAYFTTYAEAQGGYPISLGDETRIEEEFSDWTKHIAITSAEDSEPAYIRVKAFSGSEYTLVYSDASGKWTPGEDGYYYYADIVEGGQTTEPLDVKIENIPEDAKDFNVIVIHESTPVQYDEDGNPYADWNIKLDSGEVEGGNQ
ncbi:MAG: hypothetical protein HFH40_12435 [Lachnospiraceae bacterium]|nr:hypothetical protein [Lachnospiraceae bacterium]